MSLHIKHTLCCVLILFTLFHGTAELAAADILVETGQHAMLTVNITVDGAVEKPQGHRDEVVKWSTKRTFQASVEMIAGKAEKMSTSDSFNGPSESTKAKLEDIQKQAAACGNNQMCQMKVAMQMMNSSVVQGVVDAPLRYQTWRPIEKGSHLEASGNHTETLHTVFYTAARETTDCTMTAPKVSPELIKIDPASEEKWAAINKETLESSARALLVEIDSVNKVGMLNILSPLSVGSGNIECVQNIGSGPETSQHSASATLLPASEIKLPLQVSGNANGGDLIASGSINMKSSQKLNNLGVGFAVDVVAPLEVTVRWELKKIS